MALILPHTAPGESYLIAERLHARIESLTIRRLDDGEPLCVSAGLEVAAAEAGEDEELVVDAQAARYGAEQEGKNLTPRGLEPAANIAVGE